MTKLKIAIIFGQKPDFNSSAFKYFILSLNKLQKTYEFFFPDVRRYVFEEGIFKYNDANEIVEEFISSKSIIADFTICINTGAFDNNFFFNCEPETKTAVTTTHIWDKFFSPPSLFDYLVHTIYTCLIYSQITNRTDLLQSADINIHSHPETKGCIADFTRNKIDDRIDIAIGYICEKHSEEITEVFGEEYLHEVQFIIDREWIGYKEEKGSIAYNLKHIFKFDIHKDSGFNLNWWEKCREKFYDIPAEGISEIVKILITAIIASILVKYGISKDSN